MYKLFALVQKQVIRISPFEQILSHSRFLLTLRSEEGRYHSLILFRLSSGSESTSVTDVHHESPSELSEARHRLVNPMYNQIYVMESACPHLGADLSHAEIEECESTVVAVCPWHR